MGWLKAFTTSLTTEIMEACIVQDVCYSLELMWFSVATGSYGCGQELKEEFVSEQICSWKMKVFFLISIEN